MYTYRTSNTSVSEIRRAQTVSEELLCNLHKAFTVFLLIQISLKAVAIILSNQFIYIYIYIFFFFLINLFLFIFILFFTFFKQNYYLKCFSRGLNLSPAMRVISNIPGWFK